MDIDYKEDGIKMAQTTKGVWICAEVVIHTDDIKDAIKTADGAMRDINKILSVRNRYARKRENENKKE